MSTGENFVAEYFACLCLGWSVVFGLSSYGVALSLCSYSEVLPLDNKVTIYEIEGRSILDTKEYKAHQLYNRLNSTECDAMCLMHCIFSYKSYMFSRGTTSPS